MKDFKFNSVTVDVYKTKRAINASKKLYLYDVKTINEVINIVKNKFDNIYSFSIYNGDRDFIGNFNRYGFEQ